MQLVLSQLGKRFNRRWIFRDLTLEIPSGTRLGITGHNGSGKSTLLKVLSGAMPATAGEIQYSVSGQSISPDKVFRMMSFAAPYTDLIEELTLGEQLAFHMRFKPWRDGFDANRVLEMLGSRFRSDAFISSFSSGMKQRARLILAIASKSDLIFLDEPTSNLDDEGKQWYSGLLELLGQDETIVIASNEEFDMRQCDRFLNVEDYSGLK